MPTPTAATPNPAVAQAADAAVDDLLGDLSFTADAGDAAAADATETPAADDAAAAVEGEGDAEVAAEGGEAGAAEGEGDAAAAAEGEGEAAGAAEGEGEGDGAKKEDDAAAAAAAAGKPAETPAAAAPVDPAVAAREAAQAQAYQTWEKDFTSIDEKIAANKYDPIDDGPAAVKVMSQGMKFVRQAIGELHRQQEQLQTERAAEKFWNQWGLDNPGIGAQKGQAAFQEEFSAALKKHRDPRIATAVAEERWAARMKVTAGVAKSKLDSAAVARPAAGKGAAAAGAAAAGKPAAKPAGKPPTPVTPGGGRVLPAATSATRAPATRPKTFKEKFETGAYGNLAGLVD